MFKPFPLVSLAALALALPAAGHAQNYADLPPLPGPTLAPLGESEVRTLPSDMRSAPVMSQTNETVTTVDGVETITRTRRIDNVRPLPTGPGTMAAVPPPGSATYGYAAPATYGYAAPATYAPAPVVFERQQWIDECRSRTRGRSRNDTGLIIGGLLGAVAGGVAGYEIAGAGDRVLGTVLGVGGGGLLGGLIGSLFNGKRRKNLYDCEAALDSYMSSYGAPGTRIASREIAYPGYAAPAFGYQYGYPAGYSYGYTYAPPPQMVLVPVRSEMQQQVVVRETVREETYPVPAERILPAPRPSPKMIKAGRR